MVAAVRPGPYRAYGGPGTTVVEPQLGTSRGAGRRATSDWLAEELVQLIRSQSLDPGQKLPSVTDLARHFRVAPPTAREALRRLQALGLIEIRHGSGIYVLRDPDRVIMGNPYSGQLAAQVVLDLLDARILIEPHLASLAASRARQMPATQLDTLLSGNPIDGVRASADEAVSEAAPSPAPVGLDLAAHRAVAALAGNVVLAQTIESVLDFYAAEHQVLRRHSRPAAVGEKEHRAILEAVRSGRPDLAARRMSRHLEAVRAALVQGLGGTAVAPLSTPPLASDGAPGSRRRRVSPAARR